MKVLILAGGMGSRLSEETDVKPKPMVQIGGKPILWHIMKTYSHYGFNEFVILLGYKGYIIKEYFANYFLHQSDVTINLATNEIKVHHNASAPWSVTLIDTGINTMTGGRIKRARKFVENEQFMLTYGDGVADIDIGRLLEFHNNHQGAVTLTSVQPEGRFGALTINGNNRVDNFMEKPKGDGAWINGGFFVCDPKVFDYLDDDQTVFEKEPLERLAADRELYTFKHYGFWKPMDTLRDKKILDDMLKNDTAKWTVWK